PQRGRGQRAAVEIALDDIAAFGAQVGFLFGALDAFGDHLHVQVASELNDDAHDVAVIRILQQIAGEALVDLDLVQRQAPQVAQRGIAGAEVIQPDTHPGGLELLEVSGSGLDILHEAGFGDLQIQCAPIQPVTVQGAGDHLAQVRVVQLHGGEVHGHAQVRQPVTLPVPQLAAGLIQHPFAYGDDDAALLGQRDEQVRWYQPPLRVIPAQQRLDAHHPVAVQGYLWLVDQMQLV